MQRIALKNVIVYIIMDYKNAKITNLFSFGNVKDTFVERKDSSQRAEDWSAENFGRNLAQQTIHKIEEKLAAVKLKKASK